MTKRKRQRTNFGLADNIKTTLGTSGITLQLKKTGRSAALVVGGILSVAAFSKQEVLLLSHGGMLSVRGDGLSLSSLEDRTVEIMGKITVLELSYGKN